jgi:hypothetical protein
VLKARQLGVSTYVAARLYRHTIKNMGTRCIIIGHERRASSNLFEIVKRFHDGMPAEIKPSVSTANAESLLFDRLDSGYIVTVATGEGTGRSATAQLLHASETAFWDDLPLQMAALMQTVPDVDNSEIIIESTANGYNDFHTLWRKAEAGESEFLPVFLPWSLDAGYKRDIADFKIAQDEAGLVDAYGLTDEQLAWRRAKIAQLGSAEYFAQEYPLNAAEAFISASFDSFIPPELVIKARREKVEDPYGPLVIGVDPAGMGPDRTSIAWRKGRVVLKVESRKGLDTMQTAGWVQSIIRNEKPARVNIDVGGLGTGVYDRLYETASNRRIIQAVNFGGKPVEPPMARDEKGDVAGGPANRRAEMWSNLKKALEGGRFSLPDRDSLQADLVSTGYKFNSAGQLVLESKQDMRRRGLPSPDEADAVALCFADASGFPRNEEFHRSLKERYVDAYQ